MENDLGDLVLTRRIAMGGMAEIYLAEAKDPKLFGGASQLIVKRLMPRFRAEPSFVKLFTGEAKLCVKLAHPNIVRTYRAFKKELDWYMVQEYVDGGSLAQLSGRLAQASLRLPPKAIVTVMVGLLKALGYVHKARLGATHVQLVHRDVNPGNLLVSMKGEVKLTDFGVAEGESLGAERVQGALRGTPAYMSPEQVRGQTIDPRSDLFSAGIVLWELLTGRELFADETEFETLRRVAEHVPAPPSVYAQTPVSLDALVAKALSKAPEDRFESSVEFGRALIKVSKEAGWEGGDQAALAAAVQHTSLLSGTPPKG